MAKHKFLKNSGHCCILGGGGCTLGTTGVYNMAHDYSLTPLPFGQSDHKILFRQQKADTNHIQMLNQQNQFILHNHGKHNR